MHSLNYIDIDSIPRDRKINFVIIEIQDPLAIESTNRLPRLPVIVYGKDIDKINIGDRYRIGGKICIPAKAYQNPLSKRTDQTVICFHIMHVKLFNKLQRKANMILN